MISTRVRPGTDGLYLRHTTQRLLERMLSPLVGLDRGIGFTLRGFREPRFAITGAELTGVHVLRGREAPPTGFYHIGGSGVFHEEAVVRSLGETVERYSQFVSEVSGRHPIVMASHAEIDECNEPIMAASKLRFFTDEQRAVPGFPFGAFDPTAKLGWVRVRSLVDDVQVWVPAQLFMVGYAPKLHDGEPWLLASVTTACAAPTNAMAAVVNALLELVQIDAAMGHWYSAKQARPIALDARTRTIERLIDSRFARHEARPSFYWLPSPDLPGFAIACVVRGERGYPAAAVGLGIDLELERALYKALLEGVGVVQLTKWEGIKLGGDLTSVDPASIFDLDTNVALYADPSQQPILDHKFPQTDAIPASDLDVDGPSAHAEQARAVLEAFRDSGKELYFLDMTTADIAALGFAAVRFWSPDTLSLCLPSAPPLAHVRFAAYGGPMPGPPHPYP